MAATTVLSSEWQLDEDPLMLLSVHAAPAPAPHPPPSTASVQGASLQRCCSTGSSAWAAQPCWLGSVLASHSANNDSPKLLSRGRYGCIPVGTRRGLGVPMSCPLGSSPSSPSSHPRGISVCAKAGCAKDTPDGACLWCRALCAVVSFLIGVTVCFEAGKDAMYEAADKIT